MANTYKNVRKLLQETSTGMQKMYGLNTVTDHLKIINDDTAFDSYKRHLAEGLEGDVKEEFLDMSDLVRNCLINETVYSYNPQSQFVMPIFRKFWPQLTARELTTIIPMDKPELVHYFMLPFAKTSKGEVALPSLTEDISSASAFGVTTPFTISVPSSVDVLSMHGLTPSEAHLEREFYVQEVEYLDETGALKTATNIEAEPGDDGNFDFEVDCGGGVMDHVTGHVDFFNGVIHMSSLRDGAATSKVANVMVVGGITGAEEMQANHVSFKYSKVYLRAIDHIISTDWTIQLEQDTKAFFDIDHQAKIVDLFGDVVAMDIDRKLINKILRETTTFNPGCLETFSKTPSVPNYAHGPSVWAKEIKTNIRSISSKIYTKTNIGLANTIAGHPEDIEWLKSATEHSFKGTGPDGGELGAVPVQGTLDSSFKVLSSPIIPKGKMIVSLVPDNPDKAILVFCPYHPVTLTPFPNRMKPSMTFLSRYATRFIRREGMGILSITD